MAASPPGSPGAMTFSSRPMSAMVKPSPRSNSRLSMTSKAGGGSRASDEDGGRTAVKVGKCNLPVLCKATSTLLSGIMVHCIARLTGWRYSCSCSTAVKPHRSRFRSHSSAISTGHGSHHVRYKHSNWCAAGEEGLRLWSCLWSSSRPRWYLGLSQWEYQCVLPRI